MRRRTSAAVGTIPILIIPKAAIAPNSTTITIPITARPAANLPLMTSSRWIGWDSSPGSVPWGRSPLAAARPESRRSSTVPRVAVGGFLDGPAIDLFERRRQGPDGREVEPGRSGRGEDRSPDARLVGRRSNADDPGIDRSPRRGHLDDAGD